MAIGRSRGFIRAGAVAVLLAVVAVHGAGWGAEQAMPKVALKHGRLYVDGEWRFLKIGKPLRDFSHAESVEQLIDDLPMLKEKHYNCLELNCYWHHLDKDGDGVVDGSVEPLCRLINAIADHDMFPCLSVETYGVGGGNIAKGFWEQHPDAVAINSKGEKVWDTEYKFGSAVPSLFSPDYLRLSRAYIRDLTRQLPHERILYYETTVEPQFIGNQALDFSPHAKQAYETWCAENKVAGPAWPETFPVPRAFIKDPVWKRFKAESLAAWINADAAVFREVAGPDALIAVDYLETNGGEMHNRNGDSRIFLEHLTCANIIQVNWHWNLRTRSPNQAAYDNVRAVMAKTGRDWAITEHMTFNGSDYSPEEAPAMLCNTLAQGTRFGWEFVTISPSTDGKFAMYNDDWTPKPLIAVVDNQWDMWQKEIAGGVE